MRRNRKVIGSALFAAGLIVSGQLYAQPIDRIGLHIGSHHTPSRDFNNTNPGAYVVLRDGWTLGGLYNSERRFSVYAGRTFERGSLALTLGLVTGYERAPILPMVAPSWRAWQSDAASLRIAYLPRVDRNSAHVLHLMIEFKVD